MPIRRFWLPAERDGSAAEQGGDLRGGAAEPGRDALLGGVVFQQLRE